MKKYWATHLTIVAMTWTLAGAHISALAATQLDAEAPASGLGQVDWDFRTSDLDANNPYAGVSFTYAYRAVPVSPARDLYPHEIPWPYQYWDDHVRMSLPITAVADGSESSPVKGLVSAFNTSGGVTFETHQVNPGVPELPLASISNMRIDMQNLWITADVTSGSGVVQGLHVMDFRGYSKELIETGTFSKPGDGSVIILSPEEARYSRLVLNNVKWSDEGYVWLSKALSLDGTDRFSNTRQLGTVMIEIPNVPEPAQAMAMLVGLVGVTWARRRASPG
jgi:hypothetical protein